jgi:hypothetical protein
MTLNGLWPLLAHAAPRQFVAPVCSMVGTTAAQAMAGNVPPPAPLKLTAPHCPFCNLGGDHSPALPAAHNPAFAQLPSAVPPGLLPVVAPFSLIPLAAHPRGPPVIS